MAMAVVSRARKPAHPILNRFNIRLEQFFRVRGANEVGSWRINEKISDSRET
jgi:hypothetical protein